VLQSHANGDAARLGGEIQIEHYSSINDNLRLGGWVSVVVLPLEPEEIGTFGCLARQAGESGASIYGRGIPVYLGDSPYFPAPGNLETTTETHALDMDKQVSLFKLSIDVFLCSLIGAVESVIPDEGFSFRKEMGGIPISKAHSESGASPVIKGGYGKG